MTIMEAVYEGWTEADWKEYQRKISDDIYNQER